MIYLTLQCREELHVKCRQCLIGFRVAVSVVALCLFYKIIGFDFLVPIQMQINLKSVIYAFIMCDKCMISNISPNFDIYDII